MCKRSAVNLEALGPACPSNTCSNYMSLVSDVWLLCLLPVGHLQLLPVDVSLALLLLFLFHSQVGGLQTGRAEHATLVAVTE